MVEELVELAREMIEDFKVNRRRMEEEDEEEGEEN